MINVAKSQNYEIRFFLKIWQKRNTKYKILGYKATKQISLIKQNNTHKSTF